MRAACCCSRGRRQAQLNGSHSLGDFGVQSGSQPQPGFYAALFYLSLRHRHHQGQGRKHRSALAPNSPGSIAAHGRCTDSLVCEQGQSPGRELRRDGGASLGERRAGSAGVHGRPDGRHQLRRHADSSRRPRLAQQGRGRHCGIPVLRADRHVRARRQRQRRQGHVDVRAVRRHDRLLRRKRTVSLATTAFWEFHGNKKDTTTKSDSCSRSRAVWASRSSAAG